MNGYFSCKKLLLLGSNLGTLDIIRYAKAHGAITVVADYLPVEKSLGKQFADESVLISTADIEGLKKYIKENRVDGVFAGISEFNLMKAMCPILVTLLGMVMAVRPLQPRKA